MTPQRSLQRSIRRHRPSKRERQQTSSRKAGRRVKSKSSPPPHSFQCKLDGTDTVTTAPSQRRGKEQTRRIQEPLPSDQSDAKIKLNGSNTITNLQRRLHQRRNNQGNEGKCIPSSSTNVLPSPIRLADNHSKDLNISLPQDTQPNELGVGVCGVELATQRKSLPSIWRKLPTEQKFQSLPIMSAIEVRQLELKMPSALNTRKVQHRNEICGEMTRNAKVGIPDVPTRKGQLKVPIVEKNGGKG